MLVREVYFAIGLLTLATVFYYLINSYSSMRYISQTDYSLVDPNKATIVIPVYNEKENIFTEAIDSVSRQGCSFVVVGDSSYEPYKAITETRGGLFVHQKSRQGKKKALALAMGYLSTEYVMFMDSDTILPENAVSSMMSHFVNNVGGVGANLTIKKTGDPISYASEFVERSREVIFRAMSAHGNVMNLDGACVMYRTDIIRPFIMSKEFSDFSIMGKSSPLGDDWQMTGYIIKNGYKAVKDYTTKVQCYPQENVKKFFRQNLRWSRSNWIRFGRELREGTIIKAGGFYTLEMVYTFALPFIALGIGIFKLYSFFLFNHASFQAGDIFAFALFGDLNTLGSHLFIRVAVALMNLGGSAIFLGAVVQRMSGERLKTIAYGALALGVLFVTSIYGLLTFWKGNSWGTR